MKSFAEIVWLVSSRLRITPNPWLLGSKVYYEIIKSKLSSHISCLRKWSDFNQNYQAFYHLFPRGHLLHWETCYFFLIFYLLAVGFQPKWKYHFVIPWSLNIHHCSCSCFLKTVKWQCSTLLWPISKYLKQKHVKQKEKRSGFPP